MTKPSTETAAGQATSICYRIGALTLAVIASLFAGASSAQVLVTDTAAISTAEEGYKSQLAKTVEQYTKQLDQYRTQIQQYEQMVMQVQGLGTNISLGSSNLQRVEDAETAKLVDQRCPSPDGGSVIGNLVTTMASSFAASDRIVDSQQKICANIVMLQVDKYNRSVDVINELNKYGGTVQKLNMLANAVNNVGNASNAAAQAQTVSATMAKKVSDWQLAIQGDDNLIKALNDQQGILASVALNGKPGIGGQLIQGAAFALAFKK